MIPIRTLIRLGHVPSSQLPFLVCTKLTSALDPIFMDKSAVPIVQPLDGWYAQARVLAAPDAPFVALGCPLQTCT